MVWDEKWALHDMKLRFREYYKSRFNPRSITREDEEGDVETHDLIPLEDDEDLALHDEALLAAIKKGDPIWLLDPKNFSFTSGAGG
jgi:hypothetical protein